MPQKYYEFLLNVRPHKNGGRSPVRQSQAVRTVKIVARSKFDAEWAFRCQYPRMTIVSCQRGKPVDPPVS
ncbi:MAG: hypothetical protein K8I27_06700 [Planctomycetes bacterium]|nr:hypothetical protein [Planctomycetota bacterium]